jgi:dolichol-phosphate mannosyltransferase
MSDTRAELGCEAIASVSRPELSVIVPMFNERDNLEPLCDRLHRVLELAGIDFELLFVDDGSRDDSLTVARFLAVRYPRIRVLALVRNFGKEAAMLAGYDHARGRASVVLDADLQQPPELLIAMRALWRQGYEIVTAVRADTEGISKPRKLSSTLFYALNSALAGMAIPAHSADFALLDASVVQALRACREVHRFNRALVAWTGFRRTEITYTAAPRHSGRTHWNARKLLKYAMDGILSFSVRPLRLVGLAGVALSGLSFAYLLLVAVLRIVRPELAGAHNGYASIIGMICLLGGFQLSSIWLLGEYIGRIYEQVKGRPVYLVRAPEPSRHEPAPLARTFVERVDRADAPHALEPPHFTSRSASERTHEQVANRRARSHAGPADSGIDPR